MPWFEIFIGILVLWFVGYFIYYIFTKYYSNCKKNIVSGSSCTQNCDCITGACALSDNSTDLVCCPTGETMTVPNGLVYCSGYSNGNKCSYDGMCTSNNCDNGICQTAPTCDSSCLTCGLKDSSEGSPRICCKNGTVMINGVAYCNNSPYGSTCLDNSQCASGYCNGGNAGTGEVGYCASQNPIPISLHGCNSDSQCPSGQCAYWGTGSDAVCCPSGTSRLHGVYWYCSGTPSGTPCWDGTFCASGICVNGVCQ